MKSNTRIVVVLVLLAVTLLACNHASGPNDDPVRTPVSRPPSTTGKCSWTREIVGTWVSLSDEHINFAPDGSGYYQAGRTANDVQCFEWTCTEEGYYMWVSGSIEGQLAYFSESDHVRFKADYWRRLRTS